MKILFLIASSGLLYLSMFKPCHVQNLDHSISNQITTVMLIDSGHSVSIQCDKSGNTWSVSNISQVSSYLRLLGKDKFNTDNIINFQDIEIEFDSLYTIAALTGIGTKDGANIPIGVQYTRISNPPGSPSGLVTMGASETHTCTGAPCECCKFNREKGRIIGCFCSALRCTFLKGDKCNHTVVTTQ